MRPSAEYIWIWAEKQIVGDRGITNNICSPRSASCNMVRMFRVDTVGRDGHGFRELR